MKAIVRVLPGPADLQSAMGSQMAQALSAFGQPPGGRIPVDVPADEREFVVEGAVRSVVEGHAVRLLDEKDRERALVPIHRIDSILFVDE